MIPNTQLSGIYDQLVTTVKRVDKVANHTYFRKNGLLSCWLVVWRKKIWKLVWKLNENLLKSLTIWRYVHFFYRLINWNMLIWIFLGIILKTWRSILFLFGDSQRSKKKTKKNKQTNKQTNKKREIIKHKI